MDNFQKAKKLWPDNPMVPDSIEQAQKMFGTHSGSNFDSASSQTTTALATTASTPPASSPKIDPPVDTKTQTSERNSADVINDSDLYAKAEPLPIPKNDATDAGYKAIIRFNMGVKEELSHDKQMASIYYRKACELSPDLYEAHYRLAVLSKEDSDNGAATMHAKECLRIRPTDRRAAKLLSLLK